MSFVPNKHRRSNAYIAATQPAGYPGWPPLDTLYDYTAILNTSAPIATVPNPQPVAVIGAGPAGLAAAFELMRMGVPVTVLEGNDRLGGRNFTDPFPLSTTHAIGEMGSDARPSLGQGVHVLRRSIQHSDDDVSRSRKSSDHALLRGYRAAMEFRSAAQRVSNVGRADASRRVRADQHGLGQLHHAVRQPAERRLGRRARRRSKVMAVVHRPVREHQFLSGPLPVRSQLDT